MHREPSVCVTVKLISSPPPLPLELETCTSSDATQPLFRLFKKKTVRKYSEYTERQYLALQNISSTQLLCNTTTHLKIHTVTN